MSKKKKLFLIVFAVIIVAAVGIGSWYYAYYRNTHGPEWFENAKSVAYDYVENNEELHNIYGENFKFSMTEYNSSIDKDSNTGKFDAVFKISGVKYDIHLEMKDSEWSVIDFVKKQ